MIELFELDATALGMPNILRWHCGDRVTGANITWQGNDYTHYPVEATGFEINASGKLPRPTLKAANIGGNIGALIRSLKDGLGAKVTRRRTLAKYLDAVNFPSGNPTADPTAEFPIEIYYIARKASENPIFVEMELSVAFDVAGIRLPRRQVIATICPWKYRGAECGYTGGPVMDINGSPTTDPAKDQCSKTINACKARFGARSTLPYGAFPASLLVRSR
jgi:lambda family phage minor tail protein L